MANMAEMVEMHPDEIRAVASGIQEAAIIRVRFKLAESGPNVVMVLHDMYIDDCIILGVCVHAAVLQVGNATAWGNPPRLVFSFIAGRNYTPAAFAQVIPLIDWITVEYLDPPVAKDAEPAAVATP